MGHEIEPRFPMLGYRDSLPFMGEFPIVTELTFNFTKWGLHGRNL